MPRGVQPQQVEAVVRGQLHPEEPLPPALLEVGLVRVSVLARVAAVGGVEAVGPSRGYRRRWTRLPVTWMTQAWQGLVLGEHWRG